MTSSEFARETRNSLRQKRLQRARAVRHKIRDLLAFYGLSPRGLGIQVGYERTVIVKVLHRRMRPSPKFITRIELVHALMIADRVRMRHILSRRRLPRYLVINEDFGKCPVCRWGFVKKNRKQKYCDPECAAYARRMRGGV